MPGTVSTLIYITMPKTEYFLALKANDFDF